MELNGGRKRKNNPCLTPLIQFNVKKHINYYTSVEVAHDYFISLSRLITVN